MAVGVGSSGPSAREFDSEVLRCGPGARSSEVVSVVGWLARMSVFRAVLAAPFAAVAGDPVERPV